MLVQKRDNTFEDVSFDKVLNRLKKLSSSLSVHAVELAQKVCSRIYNGVKTSELDELAAHLCSSMIVEHPDYDTLASRITVSNHHKNTSPSFSETMSLLYNYTDSNGNHNPLISKEVYEVVQNHKEKLNSYIDYNRDYDFDYFGFKTLEKSYLLKVNGKTVERPQHMFMRVSLGIHQNDLKDALQTYDCMSKKMFVHATPTLFNSGTNRPQNSSCFLLANFDSIDGIFNTIKECALISKYAGGIGVHTHDVRAKNSRIRGTNGNSDGIIPMIRVFNNVARYVNQCFTPETKVWTLDGVKRMDEVSTNDYLLTSDGTMKPVYGISIKYINQDIYEIYNTSSNRPTKVTGEHEIFVMRGDSKSYMPVKDIKYGDYVGFPIPTHELEEDCFAENVAFFRFYGILVADCIADNDNVCMLKPGLNNETVDFYKTYLNFNGIAFTETNDRIIWTDDKFKKLHNWNNQSSSIENRFLNLPKVKLMSLLQGLLETGGVASNNSIVYTKFENESIIHSLRYMLLRMGVSMSCEWIDNCCRIRVLDESQVLFKDNFIWNKINKIQKSKYVGNVYDFNMVGNHNYTVCEIGNVHNSGRRNGSIAMYLEPWHADVFQFLDLKKPHGAEEERARDLFYALWIPDLFMERVKTNGKWSLMCPDQCPGLSDVWGEAFETLYTRYEDQGNFIKQINAQELWFKILESQIETGTPYLCYKDAANRKSNQQNLGTIKSSNLCVAPETLVLTDQGHFPIQFLCGKTVNVWNGKEFSSTIVHKTGEMQKLLTVEFDNGMSLRCTPYHKFYIQNENDDETKCIPASDLVQGMKIIKYTTPMITTDVSSIVKWLASWIDDYGVDINGFDVQVFDSDKEYLKDIFYILQTLGIQSRIVFCPAMQSHSINMDGSSLMTLNKYGFSLKKIKLHSYNDLYEADNRHVCVTVAGIIDKNEVDDTYCFNESKEHKAIFNGIITGQCSEIIEYTSEEEIAVCLTGDTEIVTDKGIKRIDECDNVRVLSYYKSDSDFKVNEQFTNATLIDNGTADVFEINFDGSKSIKATANHKFLSKCTMNGKESKQWKRVDELKSGDCIVSPHINPIPSFTVENIVDDFDTEYMRLGWLISDEYMSQTNRLSNMKTIPKDVKEAKSIEIGSYLSGIFSADGFIYSECVPFGGIGLSSTSKLLLEDVQQLLLCFGIKSSFVYNNISGILSIYGNKNIKRFSSSVNFVLDNVKKEMLSTYIQTIDDDVTEDIQNDDVLIKNITFVGRERVYDLNVPDSHHFIANGLITHNCNLASMCLPSYYNTDSKTFDYDKLHTIAKVVTKNLNKVIDVNFYPLEKARVSNLRHRPIGIGVQGLADLFAIMKIPFDSEEAREVNKKIFETIYHGALESSNEIAMKRHLDKDYLMNNLNEHDNKALSTNYPGAYSTFTGSPASQGKLQYDLWNETIDDSNWNWTKLKSDINLYGLRNSLLLAPMPTASTSQICGFNEMCEPFTSNLYKRKTMAGEFILINKYLLKELLSAGLWNTEMKNALMLNDGSVQNIDNIPQDIKDVYKTVWEIKQKVLIDMAAERGQFICQSQSMNLFIEAPDFKKLSSMHFYAWSRGLKTGMYYLRSKPRTKTQQFTVEPVSSCLTCSA